MNLELTIPDYFNKKLFTQNNLLPHVKNVNQLAWAKKLKPFLPVDNISRPVVGLNTSIKRCPGFVKLIQASINIPLPYQTNFFIDKVQNDFVLRWLHDQKGLPTILMTQHSPDQCGLFINEIFRRGFHAIVKVSLPFTFRLKDKNSHVTGLIYEPFYDENLNRDISYVPGVLNFSNDIILPVQTFLLLKYSSELQVLRAGMSLFNIFFPINPSQKINIEIVQKSWEEIEKTMHERGVWLNHNNNSLSSIDNITNNKKNLNYEI